MGRHRNALVTQHPSRGSAVASSHGILDRRHPESRVPILPTLRLARRSAVLPVFASAAALAFLLVSVTSPIAQTEAAQASVMAQIDNAPAQQIIADGAPTSTVVRDNFTVTKKVVVPPPVPAGAKLASGGRAAPAAGVPDPGTAQAIAHEMVVARGWGEDQYSCLVALWKKESGWNVFAHNTSSGAYGIPQSLPGSKMATAGADWATNPATQITWGLGYISGRYGDPCGAWNASQIKGWY